MVHGSVRDNGQKSSGHWQGSGLPIRTTPRSPLLHYTCNLQRDVAGRDEAIADKEKRILELKHSTQASTVLVHHAMLASGMVPRAVLRATAVDQPLWLSITHSTQPHSAEVHFMLQRTALPCI